MTSLALPFALAAEDRCILNPQANLSETVKTVENESTRSKIRHTLKSGDTLEVETLIQVKLILGLHNQQSHHSKTRSSLITAEINQLQQPCLNAVDPLLYSKDAPLRLSVRC